MGATSAIVFCCKFLFFEVYASHLVLSFLIHLHVMYPITNVFKESYDPTFHPRVVAQELLRPFSSFRLFVIMTVLTMIMTSVAFLV